MPRARGEALWLTVGTLCDKIRRMKNGKLVWFILVLIVLAIGGYYRFVGLEWKAVHHDEAVNYSFVKKLVTKGHYEYNPIAYHGPFLYYIALPGVWLGGFTKTSLRAVPAVFGLLAIILVLMTHRALGKPGALFAAAVLALSPADVYFSKTFIHEIYFAFAYAGLLWAFLEATSETRPTPVILFYVFLALAFTVKETAAFALPAFGAALVLGWYFSVRYETESRSFLAGPLLGYPQSHYLTWGLGLGLTLWALLFSSFLSNPKGLPDFFRAYGAWFATGVVEKPHAKPWPYFFVLLGKYYLPAMPFALWAAVRAFWQHRPRMLALLAVSVSTLLVYSAIPYKTPWCVLPIGACFLALAADGFTDLWLTLRRPVWQALLALVVIGGLVAYGRASYRLNWDKYDDESYQIVYVQTLRAYEDMPRDLAVVAQVSGLGDQLPVYLSTGAKNPGRFYLRYYRKLAMQTEGADKPIKQSVIICRDNEYEEIAKRMTMNYRSKTYPVFPGWWIYLLVEESLWDRTGLKGNETP